ncbi:MAG: methyltransferase domain-containing protein [Geobacteraceae bacterium]|nr:methyltransferase domain-containing protein [Geobacteraceae bacterium]
MKPPCICCCSDKIECVGTIQPVVSFAGRFLDKPLAGGELFRCRDCGVAFRHPHPGKSVLDELYRQGNSNNWQTAHSDRQDWQIAGRWIEQYLKPESAILDVGCFDGGFLKTIALTHRRFGIEIHEAAGKKAQEHGIQIIGKDFEDMAGVDETFDAVTSFDVIEHSQNPLEFLRHMAALTNNEGIVILSSGNSEALSWRFMGARYWYCTIGEHLSFICPTWCAWAGNQLGLELKQVITFCHVKPSWKQRVGDLVKNLFYKISPRGFAALRQKGMGGDEFRAHKEMLSHPPSWMSAKDHFICIFKKMR